MLNKLKTHIDKVNMRYPPTKSVYYRGKIVSLYGENLFFQKMTKTKSHI